MSEVTTNTAPDTTQAAEVKTETVVTAAPEAKVVAESKQTEQKTEAQSEAKPAVPEKYELKLPEGSPLNAKRIEEISAEAKANGWSNEQAQKALERESQAVATFAQAQQQQIKQQVEQWKTDFINDKEIGGDKANESAEYAKRFVARFGSQKLKDALDSTGLGNNPELIRMCAAAGKLMVDDKFVHSSAPAKADKSIGEVFYPTMYEKKE